MKDNNFNQVFLNTIDSKQLLSFLHLNDISANISEKSLSILLAKASFAFLLISMLSYWFQMSFKSGPEGAEVITSNKMDRNFEGTTLAMQTEGLQKAGGMILSRRGIPKAQLLRQQEKFHCVNEFSPGVKRKKYYFLEKVPFVSMWSANITLALLLSIRWIESGHFPLSNLYESLIFLSWSLTVIHLFLENLFYKREQATTLILGAISSPVALFTNAFATFSLPQEMQKVTVLVPALKSNWLIMHVSVMIISYAALLSGSLLAMAFLVIKFIEDNKIPSIMSTFINGKLKLTPMLRNQIKDLYPLSQFWTPKELQGTNGTNLRFVRFVPMLRNQIEDLSDLQKTEGVVDQKLFSYSSAYQESESSKPLLLAQRGSLIKENKVLMDLSQILDNLSYRSIGLGFALLTIGILSGAVWANEAWGSYWSWDPKETWALITWLVFALYLHTRLSKGWVGKESAFVASFGFIVIWFCYLGVNFFGKGLHSYGWFQQ